jgi:hypothetical protein
LSSCFDISKAFFGKVFIVQDSHARDKKYKPSLIVVGESIKKRLFGRSRHKWQNTIKMVLKKYSVVMGSVFVQFKTSIGWLL